jgi:hypothetical protein
MRIELKEIYELEKSEAKEAMTNEKPVFGCGKRQYG